MTKFRFNIKGINSYRSLKYKIFVCCPTKIFLKKILLINDNLIVSYYNPIKTGFVCSSYVDAILIFDYYVLA